MRGFLLHTAADTTNLGVVGPVFPDGTFEYIPIYDTYGTETSSYKDCPARNSQYGRNLADFIPTHFRDLPVHFDPDYDNYTYGQPAAEYPRSRVLEKLREGDFVFFVSSLAPYNSEAYRDKDALLRKFQRGKKDKYVTGFFTVRGAAKVYVLRSTPELALPLLNLAFHEGNAHLDMATLEKSFERLEMYGYVVKEGDNYRLTEQGSASSRSGKDIVQLISDSWSDDQNVQEQLLEKGLLDIAVLSGNVTEDVAKTSHHYRRLKSLDWDCFILIVGDPKHSALLPHAVRLTEGFEAYSFRLNDLGQAILKRISDTLRGFRWIDEDAVKVLAREICRLDNELADLIGFL